MSSMFQTAKYTNMIAANEQKDTHPANLVKRRGIR